MSEVYVFAQDNEDWSTIGECGALEPTSCLFEEIANGDSELTLEHPLDALGKYRYLQTGAVLKVEVPVRATPEIEDGRFVTSVERWTVKWTATKAESYIYSKASGGKKKKRLWGGAEVIVVAKPASGARWKVKYAKTTGWMASAALESRTEITIPDTPDGMESALPSWELREQLFRIYKITRADEGITASARHISYDLLYNLTNWYYDGETDLQTVLSGVLANCIDPHEFTGATDIRGGRLGIHILDQNPIEAILDPEEGLAARWGAQLVRDDYELFLLSKAGANRGMTIEFARNLTGVDVDEDLSNVATCIRPVGEYKNGNPLYLGGNGCIDSPLVNNYPFRRIHVLKCDNCKIGTNGVTAAIAQARMVEQAQALFASGIDLPSVSAKVTFALLGHSERYAQYRELESVYLYDEIRVRHPRLGVDLTTQVVRTVWDCMRERMTNIELGSLQALTPSVAKWQVPNGISGAKIAAGTVGSAALANDVIAARHIQAESVNAEAIQANAVTAEKIQSDAITTDKLAAGSVTAEKLSADAIDAEKIKAGVVEAMVAWLRTVTAESITTDELAAQFARLQVLIAGTATFDKATIQQLVAEAMHLTFGELGQVYIDNLMVNYAQMVSAAIGDLVVKASDGNYYHLDVAPDGSVTATQVTVTEGEINAGQTGDGRVILETDITAANLNTSNLFATFALVNRIDAARIDVDQLFAREAFLTLLRTSHIVGDKSLEIVAQDAEAAAKDAASAKDAVDNLQVGGRNLLRNTATYDGYARDSWTSIITDTDGSAIVSWGAKTPLSWNEFRTAEAAIPYALVRNKTVTFTFWARSDDAEAIGADASQFLRAIVHLVEPDTKAHRNFYMVVDVKTPTLEWTKYSHTIDITDDLLKETSWGTMAIDDSTLFGVTFQNRSIYRMQIKKLKLEIGTVATDWSPAPEDVDARIGAANSRIDDCVTHPEQATYMRVVAPGENPATPPGVYVGLSTNGERPAAEAFVDASGWFRVLNNGVSITAMGPKIQELGTLKIYETADGGHAFI